MLEEFNMPAPESESNSQRKPGKAKLQALKQSTQLSQKKALREEQRNASLSKKEKARGSKLGLKEPQNSRPGAKRKRKTNSLSLLFQLTRREISNRYRGSFFGVLWSIITPILMLAIYSFVFGIVFPSKWAVDGDSPQPGRFAVILFSGLILFQVFSEVVTRAPLLIVQNSAFVKRIVFPLELLVPVALFAALFHACVSFLILLPFAWWQFGPLSSTIVYLPLIVLPFCFMIIGFGWLLASLGTYIRDISQIMGTITTALMFLAPIFFPLEVLPDWIRPVLTFNPLTIPIEELRNVTLFAQPPDVVRLGIYSGAALMIAVLGFAWFRATRRGFADVL